MIQLRCLHAGLGLVAAVGLWMSSGAAVHAEGAKAPISAHLPTGAVVRLAIPYASWSESIPAPSDARIGFAEVAAREGSEWDLPQVLKDRGIKPDGDAYALVYQLNPSVPDLRKLGEDSVLVLPELRGGPQTARLRAVSYLAIIDLSPEKRASCLAVLAQFSAAFHMLEEAPRGTSGAGGTMDAAVGELRRIDASRVIVEANLRGKTTPVHDAQLLAAQDEFTEAHAVADRVRRAGASTADDLALLRELRESTEALATVLDGATRGSSDGVQPSADVREVYVLVYHLGETDLREDKQLLEYEIRYASKAVYEDRMGKKYHSFPRDPRAITTVSTGLCTIWAVRYGDKDEKQLGTQKGLRVSRKPGAGPQKVYLWVP